MSVDLTDVPAVAIDDADPFAPIVPDHTASDDLPPVAEPAPAKPAAKGRKVSDTPFARSPAMPKEGIIADGMTQMYMMIGFTWGVVDMPCGSAVVESAPAIGKAWEDYARANPKVRAALLKFLETGELAKLMMAHAPLAMAISKHHNFAALLSRGEPASEDGAGVEPDDFVRA